MYHKTRDALASACHFLSEESRYIPVYKPGTIQTAVSTDDTQANLVKKSYLTARYSTLFVIGTTLCWTNTYKFRIQF